MNKGAGRNRICPKLKPLSLSSNSLCKDTSHNSKSRENLVSSHFAGRECDKTRKQMDMCSHL